MNNEFLPYEQALALKELGFNEPCLTWWYKDEFVKPYWERELGYTYESGISKDCVLAPLYQQAFRWFRKEHNLQFELTYRDDNWVCYIGEFTILDFIPDISLDLEVKEYEDAELACLRKLIEITK